MSFKKWVVCFVSLFAAALVLLGSVILSFSSVFTRCVIIPPSVRSFAACRFLEYM